MTKEAQALALILPNGIFDWFEITDSAMDNEGIKIVFQEKNVPPVSAARPDTKIETKGFTEITITDFPIRGGENAPHLSEKILADSRRSRVFETRH